MERKSCIKFAPTEITKNNKYMKHHRFSEWDLVGFIDSDEEISDNELSRIEQEYNKLVDNATEEEKEDFYNNYDDGDYYPPFVAEAVEIVLGN